MRYKNSINKISFSLDNLDISEYDHIRFLITLTTLSSEYTIYKMYLGSTEEKYSILLDNIETMKNEITKILPETTIMHNKYVNKNGAHIEHTGYDVYRYDIHDYLKIIIYSCITDAAGWCFYDKNNNFISGIDSNTLYNNDGRQHMGKHIVDVPVGAYYLDLSNNINNNNVYCKYFIVDAYNFINELTKKEIKESMLLSLNNRVKELSIENKKYVNKNGKMLDHNDYNVYTFDVSKFLKIIIYSCIADAAGWCFYDKNNNFISGNDSINYYNDRLLHAEELTLDVPDNAYYLKVTNHTSNDTVYCEYSIDGRVAKIESGIDSNNILANSGSIYGLKSFIAVGDSWTVSLSYVDTQGYNVKSWAQILGDRINAECNIVARGGRDTKGLIDNSTDFNKIQIDTSQFAILFLGTNDINHNNTIGSISDFEKDDVQSFFAYYSRIIKALLKNHKFVFCLTLPYQAHNNDKRIEINAAIKAIADKYDKVFVLNVDKYNNLIEHYGYGHLSSVGYAVFSKIVEKCICDVMDTEDFFSIESNLTD